MSKDDILLLRVKGTLKGAYWFPERQAIRNYIAPYKTKLQQKNI